MDSSRRPPIEPGPEPDTTGAAVPEDADDIGLDAEDAPMMLDGEGDIIDESPGR